MILRVNSEAGLLKKEKWFAALLFFVTCLFWLSQYSYTSYVNPLLKQMGTAADLVGIIAGAYGFTQMVLRIPLGIGAAKWGKKIFITLGCLSSGIGAFLMLSIDSPVAFLIGRGLSGVGSSSWVAFTVLYASYFESDRSAQAITMLNSANQFGRLLGFLVAGMIVTKFGVKSAFFVACLGAFIAAFFSLFLHEDRVETKSQGVSLKELLQVAKDKNLILCSILAATTQFIAFSTYSSFTADRAVEIGATNPQLSFINVILVAATFCTSLLLSKVLLNFIKSSWLVGVGFASVALYCFSLPLINSVFTLYFLQIFAGIGNACTLSLLMGLSVKNIESSKRTAGMGFFQAIYGVGMTLGPIVMGGLVARWNMNIGFYVMSVIAVISLIVTLAFSRESAGKTV